ncbi:hypothetical protein TARUN_2931 [Trichoderma arundinaceum]|uniref:Domain of unknown function at the cortex 1 domain-containing protein n=1 Tax=Trichoderma arundinaceum TaxID=490622 RepID=A0A395NTS4_TRIAR|nr:hypothetical protein TARUN_2931 [Trichoderma arundinaceum]
MMQEKYILRVTAGPSYDESSHIEVPVNESAPVRISSDVADIELNVRIQDYKGLPRGSPSTSSYFSTEPHASNQDQYSISFRFTPLNPLGTENEDSEDEGVLGIRAADLQFGNDFDRPIRDKLPPGFSTAMNIVKWWIDPGLDGDAYADKPYLYGPALSSFNIVSVGAGVHDESKGGLWFEEGGDEEGLKVREMNGVPKESKPRMKWALSDANKEKWIWEYGKTYGIDFFNPYLDFANLALRLPGFQLSVARYLGADALRSDGRISHQLRYVLRNKTTEHVYLVVTFELFLEESINEDGTIKVTNGANSITNGDTDSEANGSTNGDADGKHETNGNTNGFHDDEKVETHDDDVD